ncbi:MAG: hypothetical protein IH595_08765 [Bacteroidales bacterium]|nr:hypothetical protein [Bacteroidales bacterium]
MRPNYLLVVFTFFWFGVTSLYAQDSSWELVKDADGIKVYSKELNKLQLNEILVTAEAKASVSSLVSVVEDASNHKNWIYLCKEGKVIRHINPFEYIYYSQSNAPWPFEDRDVVTKVKVVRDSAGTVFVRSTTFHDSIPKNPNYIRISYATSQWAFTPEKNGFTKIGLKMAVNLGGSIPKWLMRLTATSGPYHTVKSLLIQVHKPKYKNTHPAIFSEP